MSSSGNPWPGAIKALHRDRAQRRLYPAADMLQVFGRQGGDIAFRWGARDAVDLHQLETRPLSEKSAQPSDIGFDLLIGGASAMHAHKAALTHQRLGAAQITDVAQNALVGDGRIIDELKIVGRTGV